MTISESKNLLQIACRCAPREIRFAHSIALLEHQMDSLKDMDLDEFFSRLQIAEARMHSQTEHAVRHV